MTLVYTPKPVQPPETDRFIAPVYFDWGTFKTHRDTYAHLLINAPTGGGKSLLATYLASELTEPNAYTIAVAPHYQRGDFNTCDIVIGSGRNYGVSAEPYELRELKSGDVKEVGEVEVDFRRVLSGAVQPTVCQLMRSLVNEMDRRFQLVDGRYAWVANSDPFVNVILDEYPAYSHHDGVKDCLKQLIREARKAGIRLIILAQGYEVVALGIEGEGSIRENMTIIRLGDWATAHATVLFNRYKVGSKGSMYWADVRDNFKSVRGAMIEDVPAIVPHIETVSYDTECSGGCDSDVSCDSDGGSCPVSDDDTRWVEVFERLTYWETHPQYSITAHLAFALSVLEVCGTVSIAEVIEATECSEVEATTSIGLARHLLECDAWNPMDDAVVGTPTVETPNTIDVEVSECNLLTDTIQALLHASKPVTARLIQDRLRKRTTFPGTPPIADVRESLNTLSGMGLAVNLHGTEGYVKLSQG